MADRDQRLMDQLRAEAYCFAQSRLEDKMLQSAKRKQTKRGVSLIQTTRNDFYYDRLALARYCLGGYNAKPAAHVLQHLSKKPQHAIDYYVLQYELFYNKSSDADLKYILYPTTPSCKRAVDNGKTFADTGTRILDHTSE